VIKQFLSREFLAFVLVGGCAALVNFCVRIFYAYWMGFMWSVVLAYATGMIAAYVLTQLFVFGRGKQTRRRSALYFALVNVFAILQTLTISYVLVYYVLPALGVDAYRLEVAHAIGVITPVFSSYLGHKHWSFR
jgi:putative flippase GtrA